MPALPLVVAAAAPLSLADDVPGNAIRHADLIRAAAARVVVFPELSLTGYHLDAAAISPEDSHLLPIVEACAATDSTALVGAPVGTDGSRQIALLAIDGAGVTVAYRKRALGAAEPEHFSAGVSPGVLVVDGWRLGLGICKDTGATADLAETAALGMDVYLAGVLEHEHDWSIQQRRALRIVGDHGVPVLLASFAGSTGDYPRAAGRSSIWSATGALLAEAGIEPGSYVRATLH